MGLPILILGESGTGKSTSMRNFNSGEIKVINVANKPLPFKNKIESVSTDNYLRVIGELKMTTKKVIVIDDAQYLMANEFMRRATERGFDKFTEIAQNFWSLVNSVKDLPKDVIVYFMAHIERDANGNEKIKTIGKLLDEKITVEGMFTIVLKTNVTDGVYSFLTQNNGHDTVKSPLGMFPTYAIDNDLKYVDEKIRNYYELGEFLSDQDLAEIEETVKHDDIQIKEEKKSRRGRRDKEEPAAAAESVDNDNGSDEENNGESEKPARRTRRRATPETPEEIVNAGVDESGDAEDLPFKDVEIPEIPKRKSREKAEEPAEETPTEEAPKRRRRRG